MPRPGPIKGVVLGYHLLAVTHCAASITTLYLIEDIYKAAKGGLGSKDWPP